MASYQVQNRHFHHALVEVSSAVLDDLHGNNFLGLEILAFHDLAECSLAQNVQYQIPIPVTRGGQLSASLPSGLGGLTHLCPASSEPRMSLTYRI